MSLYPVQSSFVRGEASPRLHARASLDLYASALARCENFITLPHGGLRKRGGTYYVGSLTAGSASRVIPFIFSEDQAYAIVLGHLTAKIFAYGVDLAVTVTTPWTAAQIWKVQYKQSGDDVWLTHPDVAPQKLTRNGHTSWSIASVVFTDGPFDTVNTDDALTLYVSALLGDITITASDDLFDSSHVGRIIRLGLQNYTDIPPWEPNAPVTRPTAGAKRRYEGRIYQTETDYEEEGGFGTNEARTGATPPTHTSGTEWDGPPGTKTGTSPEVDHGFQWTYMNSGFGVAVITAINSATEADATVLIPFPEEVMGSGNESAQWRWGAFWEDNYPKAVGLFEERLVYGKRFSVFGSKSFQFDKFQTGENADDGLDFPQSGAMADEIVWLEDIDGFLAIGTTGGVRSLSGSGLDEALTPTSFKNRRSRTLPCASIQPVNGDKTSIYVTKGRKGLAELTLTQAYRFSTEDLGQISEHIPKKGVIELAYQSAPDPVLWFPLDTGELGGFTHQPAQEVRGMHRHLLGGVASGTDYGVVESACVTPGQNGQDDVWYVVRRTVNGSTVRYLEIQTPAFEYGDIEDAFQVDCGLSYEGSAATTFSGLSHLIGQTVDVLASGRVYTGLTVNGSGQVSLPVGAAAATKAHIGLPYEAGADTLELDVGGKDGSLVGRRKRVNKVILSLFETDLAGLEIRSMLRGSWERARLPSIVPAPTDGTVTLYTGNIEIPIEDSWQGQGRITIRHTNPTPCTIRAITPVFDSEP